MHGKLRLFLGVVVALSLLAACAPPTPQVIEKVVEKPVVETVVVEKPVVETVVVEKPRVGGTLVVDMYASFTSLDPASMNDFPGAMYVGNVCEGLTSIDPTDPNNADAVLPALAESWEKSDDNKVWTFHLREDVKFHDGTPLDAEAVKFSLERVIDEDHPYHTAKMAVASAFYGKVESVEVVDSHTVNVTLADPPYLNFLYLAHTLKIVSPTAAEKMGPEGFEAEGAVCTGPFKVHKYEPAEGILDLRRFEDYWQPDIPKVDRVVFKLVQEAAVRIAELETGAADVITNVPVDDVARLEANPDIRVIKVPSSMLQGVFYYLDKEPWNDVRLRQAISYGIDRELMSQTVYAGLWPAAKNSLLPYTSGWDPDSVAYSYDPEKAKQLLAEAGYPDGMEVKLSMPATSGMNPAGVRWGEFIQEQLKKINIEVELDVREGAPYWDALISGEGHDKGVYDLWYWGRMSTTGDAILDWLANWECDAGGNFARYCSSDYGELLAQAQAASSPEEQADLIAQIGKLFDDEAAYAPLVTGSMIYAVRADLADVYPTPRRDMLRLEAAYLQ